MNFNLLKHFLYPFQIDDKDIYPKIICDECLRELLIVAKFKEKVKHSENTLIRLVASDDKASDGGGSNDVMVEETEIVDYAVVKEESDVEVTDSYEEIEFLEINGQTDTLNGIQIVTDDKCNDDEFIDEIIEECSDDTDVDHTVHMTDRNAFKVCVCPFICFFSQNFA